MSGLPVPARLTRSAAVMAAVFAGSGVLHLARPALYDSLVPPALPCRRGLIYASGIAELVCAGGLFTRATWAPPASAALLVAVWPGNWYMAVELQNNRHTRPAAKAAAWARLPLQLVMIRAVWRSKPHPRLG